MLILFQNGWEGAFKTTSVSVMTNDNGFIAWEKVFSAI